jgi:hypothetical protein
VAGNKDGGGWIHRKERKVRKSLKVISNSSNAGFEVLSVEIDEKSQFQLCKLQISDELSCMNGKKGFYRLYFKDDLLLNQNIQPISTIQW